MPARTLGEISVEKFVLDDIIEKMLNLARERLCKENSKNVYKNGIYF